MPNGPCLACKCAVAGVAVLKWGGARGRRSTLHVTGSPGTQSVLPDCRNLLQGGLFSILSSLVFPLKSPNKPDCCSPLLKNLRCVSIACKMKVKRLVWLAEPPAAAASTCPAAGISVSRMGRLPVCCGFHEAGSQQRPHQPFSEWSVSHSSFSVPAGVHCPGTFLEFPGVLSAVPATPCWER